MLRSVARNYRVRQVAQGEYVSPNVPDMVVKMRDDWRDWHVRFSESLDAHKERTGDKDIDVAEAAGVSRASITHWRAGRRTPQLNHFFQVCDVIKADPAYILFGKSVQLANDIAARLAFLPSSGLDTVLTALEGAEARVSRVKTGQAN